MPLKFPELTWEVSETTTIKEALEELGMTDESDLTEVTSSALIGY